MTVESTGVEIAPLSVKKLRHIRYQYCRASRRDIVWDGVSPSTPEASWIACGREIKRILDEAENRETPNRSSRPSGSEKGKRPSGLSQTVLAEMCMQRSSELEGAGVDAATMYSRLNDWLRGKGTSFQPHRFVRFVLEYILLGSHFSTASAGCV